MLEGDEGTNCPRLCRFFFGDSLVYAQKLIFEAQERLCSLALSPGGGELPYETDGDARRKF